jgi:uracil-DNA glycosylase
MRFSEELGSWFPLLKDKVDFGELGKQLSSAEIAHQIYPEPQNIFRIFKELNPYNVRVILAGLDPYHNGQAIGVAFGVNSEPIPASLRIIKAELESSISDLQIANFDYSLMNWVRQGVFLYNTALTVEEGKPTSHLKMWEPFTKAVFEVLRERTGLIYVLWGNEAKKLEPLINTNFNHILTASHPASEAYRKNSGFYGCNHFNLINKIIEEQNGIEFKITW